MNTTAAAYEAALRPLSAVVDAVPADAWDRPSPCSGWSARQVVDHLVSTQRDLLQQHDVDPGPDLDLTDPAAALREHAARTLMTIRRDEIVGTSYDGFFGPTTVGETLEQFYIWDMLVHRWDIARATGGDEAFSDAELDRIESGAETFGEALHSDGVCGPEVPVAADADRATRVLGRLGRVATRTG